LVINLFKEYNYLLIKIMAYKILNISNKPVFIKTASVELGVNKTLIVESNTIGYSDKILEKKNKIFIEHIPQEEYFQLEMSKNSGQKIVVEKEEPQPKASTKKDKK